MPGTAMSPSSRRAWIEIYLATLVARKNPVALLAEGVDRNTTTPVCRPSW